MIRYINLLQAEKSYIKSKFEGKDNLVNVEARLNIHINKTVDIMKCCYSINYYKESDKEVNQEKTTNEYPQYSKKETQSHIIQYRKIVTIRVDFIVKLFITLKEKQSDRIMNIEVR